MFHISQGFCDQQLLQVHQPSLESIKNKTVYFVLDGLQKHLSAFIGDSTVERLMIINLDIQYRIRSSKIVSSGTVDHVFANLRLIADHALYNDAYGIVIAHNHTSGDVSPSWDDVTYTRCLNQALSKLDIFLVDHFITSSFQNYSLRRNCLIF